MCKTTIPCNFQICCTIAAIFVALTGALSDQHAAHAQGSNEDYVDVGVTLEVLRHQGTDTPKLNVIAVNNGSRTAHDVEVVVDVVSPEDSSFFELENPIVPVGRLSQGDSKYSIRWSIPELGELQREVLEVKVRVRVPEGPVQFDNSRYPHELLGRVTTSSFESDIHKGNNTSRVWSYVVHGSGIWWQAAGNYSVVVSVDNRSPSPGETVNFTVATNRATRDKNHLPAPPIDLKVDIDLTGGLSVTGTPTYASGSDGTLTTPSSVRYRNGVFEVGTLKGGTLTLDPDPVQNSVTLPVTVSSSAAVNEQCLTARLTGNPPPGVGPHDDDISDNMAKVCLGQQEPPYFSTADIREFTSHPCVGNTDSPCDATDDIRVRAVDTTFDPPLPLVSETPLISVPDNARIRKYDSDTNSVNSEDIVSWQTPVDISLDEYSSEHERWSNVSISISYEMLNKNDEFDRVHFRGAVNALLNNDQRSVSMLSAFNPGASNNGPFELTGEFEKLGTYKVSQTVTATHDNNTDMDTSDDVEYAATGSYIFHVGPMSGTSGGGRRRQFLTSPAGPERY